eukprot:gene4387-4641_t
MDDPEQGGRIQVMPPEKETSKPALAVNARPDAKAYEFDACLNGSTSQAQLFDICAMDELVEAAVQGYHVTIFAFGQTGSGKTYSIIGPSIGCMQASATGSQKLAGFELAAHSKHTGPDVAVAQAGEEQGLLPRCVEHMYDYISAGRQDISCSVTASCCEIYNEAVTDLLASNKAQQLQVRQGKNDGFYVEGLTQANAPSAVTALGLLAAALQWRHSRSHKLNAYSSRSHCVITLTVASQDLSDEQGIRTRRSGKLVLVDLAGSERLKDTGNNAKEAVRETGAINKSLFTLGQVLAALSVRGGCGVIGHVPYRDSRLTQLLWEGLRGGGRTLMLACLCPLKSAAEESLNTLHFASMALRIKSEPVLMMDPQDQMVLDMRGTIKMLQEDCRSLASALNQMTKGVDVEAVLQNLPPTLLQDAMRYGCTSAPSNQHASCSGSPGSKNGSRSLLGSPPGRLRGSRTGTGDLTIR